MASTNRTNGEGSIYRRHGAKCPPAVNGKRPVHKCSEPYVGSVVVGWNGDKPIRRKVSGTSKTDVSGKIKRMQEAIRRQEMPVGTTPTVEKWLNYWLDEIAAKKVRPSTLEGYREKVRNYLIPLLGSRRIDKLTPEHIADAWQQIQTYGRPGEKGNRVEGAKAVSSTTAHQAHRILSRALKVAMQRGHVTRNVATLIDAPQPADVEMEPLKKDEALRVLEAVAGRRNAARWRVGLSLGLRQGEALGLRWDDIDLDAGTMAVKHAIAQLKGEGLVLGPVKSRAGRRVIRLPDQITRELKAQKKAQAAERLKAGTQWVQTDAGGYVFAREDGRPLSPSNDWREWTDLLASLGIDHRRLHDARHTAATMLLLMGVPPRVTMEILGHSRITITQKYQHVVDEMHDDAAAKMQAFWG